MLFLVEEIIFQFMLLGYCTVLWYQENAQKSCFSVKWRWNIDLRALERMNDAKVNDHPIRMISVDQLTTGTDCSAYS